MELLSTYEAAGQLGVEDLASYLVLRGPGEAKANTYYLPRTTVHQTILARSIGRIITTEGLSFLQITYWSDDADSNQQLFYGYRRGFGDERSLAEASVYKFSPEDGSHLASILSLVIYFGWDARIFDPDLTYQLTVNNDGFLDYESTTLFGNQIEQEFSLLGLTEMTVA